MMKNPTLAVLGIFLLAASCAAPAEAQAGAVPEDAAVATFAGGCFWCMEPPFEKLAGVYAAISGYTGGPEENPSYKEVSYGKTGHTEAVQVFFDPEKVSYEKLLHVFWRSMDPTDGGGQFADRGSQYRPAIFVHDAEQRAAAEASKADLEANGPFDKPIVVPVLDAGPFWEAEAYHQDYYKKNAGHYQRYRVGSGRAGFLEKTWAHEVPAGGGVERYVKPSDEELRARLTPLQYEVTQQDGTEPPFNNEFWDNKRAGIYVDVVSGEPLFSSTHKFKSGTGWPSFTRPLVGSHVVEKTDRSYGMVRIEVRSKYADSHLGHLFDDGPAPTGMRYCINSAALRFVPAEELDREGYGDFAGLFKD